jgi:hypothetical protein
MLVGFQDQTSESGLPDQALVPGSEPLPDEPVEFDEEAQSVDEEEFSFDDSLGEHFSKLFYEDEFASEGDADAMDIDEEAVEDPLFEVRKRPAGASMGTSSRTYPVGPTRTYPVQEQRREKAFIQLRPMPATGLAPTDGAAVDVDLAYNTFREPTECRFCRDKGVFKFLHVCGKCRHNKAREKANLHNRITSAPIEEQLARMDEDVTFL